MDILGGLEPKKVFKYFEEICRIPHGSRNTGKISDYCVEFAKIRQLKVIRDSSNNIIIFKDGSKGYENSKPVIIQGHLDMVCEKEKDYDIDFLKDGLKLKLENDNIMAEGTTLGGDDGIAVAIALAILDSDDIDHPPLEVVFTVDEEIGMLGAAAIDCSTLKSRIMLNLDSEEEGHLLVGCAGGVTATCHLPVSESTVEGKEYEIIVNGLIGGHSGVEIHKGRANASQVLGRVLFNLRKEIEFNIVDINGGFKDNAIPREAIARIVAVDEKNNLENWLIGINNILKNEYKKTDREINVSVREISTLDKSAFDENTTKRVISALVNLPGGIQKMSFDIEGLVETSLNLGILKTDNKEVTMSFSVRSSVRTEKEELVCRLESLMEVLEGYVTCEGEYPAWEYKEDSILRSIMIDIYKEQTGKEPIVETMHAGVECGLFAEKLSGLDCVSFGPNIYDIHTTAERMSVASIKRTWEYVLAILKRLK